MIARVAPDVFVVSITTITTIRSGRAESEIQNTLYFWNNYNLWRQRPNWSDSSDFFFVSVVEKFYFSNNSAQQIFQSKKLDLIIDYVNTSTTTNITSLTSLWQCRFLWKQVTSCQDVTGSDGVPGCPGCFIFKIRY